MSLIKRISLLLVGPCHTVGGLEETIVDCGARRELMGEEEIDGSIEKVGGTAVGVDNGGSFAKRGILEGSLDGTRSGCEMADWSEACSSCGKTCVDDRANGSLTVERGGEGSSTWMAFCR